MNAIITLAYLAVAGLLFWQSGNRPERRALHRAMLYLFALTAMLFGSARFLVMLGEEPAEWRWMIESGHFSFLAFSALWVWREREVLVAIKGEANE